MYSKVAGVLGHIDRRMADMEQHTPLLSKEKMTVPAPSFTLATRNARGKRIPQAIAHRGYKAAFPENTMGAFKGAAEVGAHAIETDIHLSRDGVVVLSHDKDLKRCFGVQKSIIDCDWSYLSTLETLKEPHQRMPRLKDLLEFLSLPGQEHLWILLDIKLDNNEDDVMRLIAETIAAVPSSTPWEGRILLGIWATKYLPLCAKYLPTFPITHIGFSIPYARQFLPINNVSFNMAQPIMVGPRGAHFLRVCRKAERAVYVWTVNKDCWMRWSIRKGLDGVITDDPKRYLEVVAEDDDEHARPWPWSEVGRLLLFNVLVLIFGVVFAWRHGGIRPVVKEKTRVAMPA